MTIFSMPGMARSAAGKVRIGLLGMYASRNLGDTAIQIAVMRALRARRSEIEFIGLCQDPEDTVRTFGISAFASSGEGPLIMPGSGAPAVVGARVPGPGVARRLAAIFRIQRQMRELDMLLVSGSGQVDDFWGGPWGQPFRLFVWCAAARSQRKPVVFFGVGVDEVTTRLGAWFSVRALELAQLRMLRDGGSLDALRAMGLVSSAEIFPDPAFYLVGDESRKSDKAAAALPFAVISPISRRAWPGTEDASYGAYLSTLAAVGDELQRQAIEVRFVCSQTKMDPPIVDRVRERMSYNVVGARDVAVKTVDEYLSAVSGASVLVGSRLHALILALVVGTPVVAVSAVRKVGQQLTDIELPDHAFDLRSVRTPELLARIHEILQHQDSLRTQIHERTREFRRQLDVGFDRVADLIPRRSG